MKIFTKTYLQKINIYSLSLSDLSASQTIYLQYLIFSHQDAMPLCHLT